MPKPYTRYTDSDGFCAARHTYVCSGRHLHETSCLERVSESPIASSAAKRKLAAIPARIMSASESQPMLGSEPDSEEVSGSGDESMEESGDSESDEEQEVLEPKVLPARGTRGNRMNILIAEEDSADEDFWQQEFFAEENKDAEYEKSSEGEDEADTDFSESVGFISTVACCLSIRLWTLWRCLCFLNAYHLLTLLQRSSSDPQESESDEEDAQEQKDSVRTSRSVCMLVSRKLHN